MRTHKETCMCASCKSKKGLCYGKNNPNYRGGISTATYNCKEIGCKNKITYVAYYKGNGRCRSCARKQEFAEGRPFSDSHKKAISISKLGSNHPKWAVVGSYYKDRSGYIKEKIDDGKWVAQQKIVVEKYIGRKLLKGEVVHHIDGNKSNNSLDNLYVFSKVGLHTSFTVLVKYNIISPYVIKSNLDDLRWGELND